MTSRLRNFRRTVRVMFTDGFRAAPVFMTLTLVFIVITSISMSAYVLGLEVMIQALRAGSWSEMAEGAILTAVLYTLGWAFGVVAGVERAGLTDRVVLYVRTRMAALVTELQTVEHFERPDYLRELDLLAENAQMLGSGPGQVLGALQTLLVTAAVIIILAVISPILLVLPLFAVPPILADRWSVRLRERSDNAVAEQRRLANELFALAATPGPAKELRLSGLQDEFARRYKQLGQRVTSATVRASLAGAAVGAAGWLLFAMGFVGGIALVVVQAAHGTTSLGEVVVAVSLLRRAQIQVGQSANLTGQMAVTARTARRFFWLEDFGRSLSDGPGERTAEVPTALSTGIVLERVNFCYPGTDRTVLREIDLHLPAGSTVALVGENGAGKTTLVKLLTGMYWPDGGTIRVDGIDLSQMELGAWRRRVSVTFQDFVPYQLLAGETVGVGDLPRIDDTGAIMLALDRASAHGVVETLLRGLSTPLGRSFVDGQDLSGGQWQKLALGRGMMRDQPLLMVLDEPTASLDAPTEHAIFERSMDQARRVGVESGAITLLISHRFSTVRMADLIVVLDGGRILESGSHQELVAQQGRYAELFELQARSYR